MPTKNITKLYFMGFNPRIIIFILVIIAILLGCWRNVYLEHRYQDRVAKAREVARSVAKEKCNKSKYKGQCAALSIYPPEDSIPIGTQEAWSFSASTQDNVDDPDDKYFYANVTIVRNNDDTYALQDYQDDFSPEE